MNTENIFLSSMFSVYQKTFVFCFSFLIPKKFFGAIFYDSKISSEKF